MMSNPTLPLRTLPNLRQAIRHCRAELQPKRNYATTTEVNEPVYPSLQSRYPPSSRGFRPSQATKQNRFDAGLKKIPVIPPPRSTTKSCPDPIDTIFKEQLQKLDPTGARSRLFAYENAERARPGDILLVRMKSGDPFAGVCLNIRKRNSPIDTAILLRNQLTRVGVEMWFKVYSPNVEGIEIVQRKEKRARRAKLYYMRQPRHDMGSVDNIVRQYQRQRIGTSIGSRASSGRSSSGGNRPGKKR